MSNPLNRSGRLATFVAGGLAAEARPDEPADAAAAPGRASVAILVGVLIMPLVVGIGMATDPGVRGAARAALATAPAAAPQQAQTPSR